MKKIQVYMPYNRMQKDLSHGKGMELSSLKSTQFGKISMWNMLKVGDDPKSLFRSPILPLGGPIQMWAL